jgi:hypothetical protein
LARFSSAMPKHGFHHGESAPPEKVLLAGGEHHTLDRVIGDDLVDHASSSSITSSVKTFIDLSVMSQVTSAMPSASTSTV